MDMEIDMDHGSNGGLMESPDHMMCRYCGSKGWGPRLFTMPAYRAGCRRTAVEETVLDSLSLSLSSSLVSTRLTKLSKNLPLHRSEPYFHSLLPKANA